MCSHRPTYSTDLLETWATTRSVIMIQRRVMIASNDSRMAVWDQLARLVTFTVCSQTILSRISKSSQDIAHNSPFYVVCPPWLMKMTLVVWAASRDPQRRTGLILTTQQYNSVGLLTNWTCEWMCCRAGCALSYGPMCSSALLCLEECSPLWLPYGLFHCRRELCDITLKLNVTTKHYIVNWHNYIDVHTKLLSLQIIFIESRPHVYKHV